MGKTWGLGDLKHLVQNGPPYCWYNLKSCKWDCFLDGIWNILSPLLISPFCEGTYTFCFQINCECYNLQIGTNRKKNQKTLRLLLQRSNCFCLRVILTFKLKSQVDQSLFLNMYEIDKENRQYRKGLCKNGHWETRKNL